MARPKKNIEDKQIRKFDFGINNDQLNLLKKFHLDSGVKIRDYILKSLNKGSIIIYEKDTEETNYLIRKIGNNINQISRKANYNNTTSSLDYDYLKDQINKIFIIMSNLNKKQK